jgi:Zn-dependent protease with chaperone function
MNKLWIDTLENGQRRRLMLALRMAPSIGAIAVGGGLTTLTVAAGMFGLLGAAGKFLDSKLFEKITDKDILSRAFKGRATEDSGRLQQMGNDLSSRFGVSPPVNIFIGEGAKPKFAVTIGHSVSIHSKVEENWTSKELEFLMAHEIAHIKAGDCARARVPTKSLIEQGVVGLALAELVQIFAQASFPIMVAGIGIGSTGLLMARRLIKNFESHSIERCRDREAVQKTGDLQSALSVMGKITPAEEAIKSPGSLTRFFREHPPYRERVVNLVAAYYEAANSGAMRPEALSRAAHSTGAAAFGPPRISK